MSAGMSDLVGPSAGVAVVVRAALSGALPDLFIMR
jgi:hypothetical protein